MQEVISREAALAALKEYNHESFHIQHALTVEGVMRWYANEMGYGEDADFWATVGLLHDIDFEMWPEQHCIKAPELLKKAGAPTSSSTLSVPTATVWCATWSPPTRWRRCCSPPMN